MPHNPSWAKAMAVKAAKNVMTGLVLLLALLFFTVWGWPKVRGGFFLGYGIFAPENQPGMAQQHFQQKPKPPKPKPLGTFCPLEIPPALENLPKGCGPGPDRDFLAYLKITNQPFSVRASGQKPENVPQSVGEIHFEYHFGADTTYCPVEVFDDKNQASNANHEPPSRAPLDPPICGTVFTPMPELLNFEEINQQLNWPELEDSTQKQRVIARVLIDTLGNPVQMKVVRSSSPSTQKQLDTLWKDLKFSWSGNKDGQIQGTWITILFRPKTKAGN